MIRGVETRGWRGAGEAIPPPQPPTIIFWSKIFFFYVKLENTKFLLVNNKWDFSLFIEEDT